MAKKKLPPIPKPTKAKVVPAGRKIEPSPEASASPDLSHIAEGLRPLAVPVAEIAFMTGNAVRHPDKQIEEIRASLRQFGQVEALIVNRRESPAVVIGGNGRLQAMLAEGWAYAAVCFVDLDKAKANALSIALNRTAEGRVWDREALDVMLRDVNTGNDDRLDAMLADLAKEQKLYPDDEPKPDQGDQTPPAEAEPEPEQVETAALMCPACGHEFPAKFVPAPAPDQAA